MSAEDQPQDSARRRRRAERAASPAVAAPPAQPEAPFPPLDLVSKDELE